VGNRARIFKGFTLVELIVTIAILSILGTIGFTQIKWFADSAKNSAKIADLNMINTALNLASNWNQQFSLTGLKPITYKAYPQDATVYVWELWNNISWLSNPPVDPFTKKPYILAIYVGGNGQVSRYAQVGSVIENNGGTRIQKIVGSYNSWNIFGMSWLMPRWALENYEDFKKTEFYTSGSTMYGAGWSSANNYIFATDELPVTQVAGYTNTGTLLYESFEGLKAEVITQLWSQSNNFKPHPVCTSKGASFALSFEFNTRYTDQVLTTDCSVDSSTWANSSSSFYLKWVRDSAAWDGQYTYVIIDPTKKYEYSFDVKWHLNAAVSGWKLNLNFYCYKKSAAWVNTSLGWVSYLATLNPTAFTKISAYVNAPDPFWNNLSITLPGGITESTSCIFYRSNAPKSGDELWFDNYMIKEIP
jgi:prepilin-type N-terminal cleavage/methylation domain-containing protein